jgi:hypothetical protein
VPEPQPLLQNSGLCEDSTPLERHYFTGPIWNVKNRSDNEPEVIIGNDRDSIPLTLGSFINQMENINGNTSENNSVNIVENSDQNDNENYTDSDTDYEEPQNTSH